MGQQAATILLLEDDREVSKLLSVVLQRQGYTVLQASNGDEARRIGERHEGPVDLVLSDVVLGNETAASVVAALRARRPQAPVLFLSGFPLEGLFERGLLEPGFMAAGSASFLQKPFSPDALIREVESVLAGDGNGSAANWSKEVSSGVGCPY